MKEEWKVFIRGVDGRGNEIIKILTDLGGKNNSEWTDKYMSSYYIYIINHKGNISSVSINSETAKIIMDNYREIKLPEKWKDGDVLYIPQSEVFVVFRRYAYMDGNGRNHFETYFCIDENRLYLKEAKEIKGYPRLATPSEVEHFHELLHVHGKDWDAEKKQVVDWKWKPPKKEGYYYIDNDSDIVSDTWDENPTDDDRYNFGNVFRTREEAEAAAERVKKALKGE